MEIYSAIIFFVVGATLGSFYNVVGLRLPKKESFTKGRSYCQSCRTTLGPLELIPIFSYLLQRGRCKHCQTKFSVKYILVELAAGLLFMASYLVIGFDKELITALVLFSLLIIVFVADLNYMLIPNKLLLFFLPLIIIARIISPLNPWYDSIIGSLVGFFLIALIIIASKGGMGAGDMKLFGVLGIVLGWKNILLTFFIASLIGTIVGFGLRFMKRNNKNEPIAFGPHIVIATVITYFYGHEMIAWYLGLL